MTSKMQHTLLNSLTSSQANSLLKVINDHQNTAHHDPTFEATEAKKLLSSLDQPQFNLLKSLVQDCISGGPKSEEEIGF